MEEKERSDLAKSEAENITQVHEKDLNSGTMPKDAGVVEYRVNDDIQMKETFQNDMFKQVELIHTEKDKRVVAEDTMRNCG